MKESKHDVSGAVPQDKRHVDMQVFTPKAFVAASGTIDVSTYRVIKFEDEVNISLGSAGVTFLLPASEPMGIDPSYKTVTIDVITVLAYM